MKETICDVDGFKVGFSQDKEKFTGVTVLLCPENTMGGIDLRGSATSTRQCDALQPTHIGQQVHAVCFAGGSAFGLDSAAGVMKHLSENGLGMNVGFRVVPVVPTAVIFDCALGEHEAFPTPEMAYEACKTAGHDFVSGSVGAGCGASVGKVFGITQAMKGGQGTAMVHGAKDLKVGALAVVNAYGDVFDPVKKRIVAGARMQEPDQGFLVAEDVLAGGNRPVSSFENNTSNTVLVAVATNGNFDKNACCRIAKMAQAGMARCFRPCHSLFDGDVVIALSTGKVGADENAAGALAAQAVEMAIMDAIYSADGFGTIPDAKSYPPSIQGDNGK